MDRREDALNEALQKNEEETQRWETYLKENETAMANMSMFCERLTVEVMVPVGKKAYMPGNLMHTNEVLVGHYQGYFSKCSTFKAKEICELRVKMAKKHIKKLETEAKLWQNKLEKPYAEGVMPTGEEREIIEDYDEENERLWKEKHKVRVKQAKQKEREEREIELSKRFRDNSENLDQIKEKTDEEIFKMLEEAELIEELEQELDKLEEEEINDEIIRKLMSGEMKLPQEKKRIAHGKKTSDENSNTEALSSNIVKKNEIKEAIQINTNNNVRPNPEITDLINSEGIDATEDDPVSEEVTLIKELSKFFNPIDHIAFYEFHMQMIKRRMQFLSLNTPEGLNEKIRLLNVLEHLEELLEEAEESVSDFESAKNESEAENEIVYKEDIERDRENTLFIEKNKFNQKRHISFALKDQTVEFRRHDTVTQMLSPKKEKPQRDIIKLDDEENAVLKEPETKSSSIDKKHLIQSEVQKNLQFVSENQSKQDFDLVGQILQTSMGEIKTLHIKFKHSKQEGFAKNNELTDIPGSPADFYDFYIKSEDALKKKELSILFINSYEGEDQVKVPVLKEADRQNAFVDPKAEFSNPTVEAKSILKNKSAVDKENHWKEPLQNEGSKKAKKKAVKNEEDECFSAYYKVMNDVIEKPLTEPDPLPNVKFIDVHTPKKRISRFKQMRQGTQGAEET